MSDCFWKDRFYVTETCGGAEPPPGPSFQGVFDEAFFFSAASASNNRVYTLARDETAIYAAGLLSNVDPLYSNFLVKVDPATGAVLQYTPYSGGGTQLNSIVPIGGGKLLVGGSFTSIGGVSKTRIARLNVSDLSTDTSFTPGGTSHTSATDWQMAVQSTGKIIYRKPNVGGATYLGRLNPDGTEDGTFVSWNITSSNPNGGEYTSFSARTIVLEDDSIIVFGSMNRVNGVLRYGVAKLTPDGDLDESFDAGIQRMTSTVFPYLAPSVESVIEVGDRLIIIGDFDPHMNLDTLGSVYSAVHVNKWDGSDPQILHDGTNISYPAYRTGAVLDNGQVVLAYKNNTQPHLYLYDSNLELLDTFDSLFSSGEYYAAVGFGSRFYLGGYSINRTVGSDTHRSLHAYE